MASCLLPPGWTRCATSSGTSNKPVVATSPMGLQIPSHRDVESCLADRFHHFGNEALWA